MFSIIYVALSCNGESKKNIIPETTKYQKLESFGEFNSKFHSDSIFQISRIKFPIGGKYVDDVENKNWTPKNWNFQRTEVSEKNEYKDFEHSLSKSDTLIVEKFWLKNSGFKAERKFRRINGKWFLIFYNEVNL